MADPLPRRQFIAYVKPMILTLAARPAWASPGSVQGGWCVGGPAYCPEERTAGAPPEDTR